MGKPLGAARRLPSLSGARSGRRQAVRRYLARRSFLLLLVPGLAMYLGFIVYPFLSSFVYSFYSWNGVGPLTGFVGLNNYWSILTSASFSPFFYRAILHNLVLFGMSTVLTTIVGMFVAYLLTGIGERASRVFQIVFFLPAVIPSVVVGFLFSIYLAPNFGVVSTVLQNLGLEQFDLPWLGSEDLALPLIGLITAWTSLGFSVLLFLAAMVGLPTDLLEAARVDGANRLQLFTRIVFPLLRSTFVTLMNLTFIFCFGAFDLIFVLESAQAGPNFATDVSGTLFYRTAFGGLGTTTQNLGLAAGLAVVGFIIVMSVSAVFVWLQRKFTVQY